MGFGLTLIGFTAAYLFPIGLGGLENYAFAGLLIGYFLCYLGLSELKKYSPVFNFAFIFSIILTAFGLFETLVGLDNILSLGLGLYGSTPYNVFSYVRFLFDCGFNIALLYGVIDISKRVDYEPTKNIAYTGLIFVSISYIFELVAKVLDANPIEAIKNALPILAIIAIILKLLYIISNIYLLFRCYAFICPSEDVDMKRKKSKFEFINKIHERNDKKEQENMELTRKLYENKIKKKNQNSHGKKKKRK